ncbi:hypothetical protein Tco_1335891 [Tanacetum coccineum]
MLPSSRVSNEKEGKHLSMIVELIASATRAIRLAVTYDGGESTEPGWRSSQGSAVDMEMLITDAEVIERLIWVFYSLECALDQEILIRAERKYKVERDAERLYLDFVCGESSGFFQVDRLRLMLIFFNFNICPEFQIQAMDLVRPALKTGEFGELDFDSPNFGWGPVG